MAQQSIQAPPYHDSLMRMQQIILPVGLWLALATDGFGACNPEDVQFYLDRGFSQEQITKICSIDTSDIPEYTPYEPPAVVIERAPRRESRRGRSQDMRAPATDMDLSAFTDQERAAIETLISGADVIGLMVDEDSVQYTKQACLDVREDPDFPQHLKLCPEVDYRILRAGLGIGKYGREFGLFGKATVTIEGRIQRFPQQDFTEYPRKYQQKLKPHFNWQTRSKSTRIAIRSGHTASQIAAALKTLARAAETNPQADRPEPARKDKKKRWWNPFD